MTPSPADPRNSLDADKPAEIAALVESAGVAKAGLALTPLLTRAVLAGAFIAFGALFYVIVPAGATPPSGALRFAGGVALSLGPARPNALLAVAVDLCQNGRAGRGRPAACVYA